MAASTSTTLYSTTPLAGIDLGSKGSTPPNGIKILTRLNGSDGHVYLLCKASEALGSITTVIIGAAGSASSDSGSAGWTLNCPGGLTTGQYGFAKRTSLA